MKSAERHKLETNWLATNLDRWIEDLRPYSSTITGVFIAVAVLAAGWYYFAHSSSARDREAWDAFDNIVGGSLDEQAVTQIGKSAEEFTDTDMNPWARVTSADGQVWIASRTILQDRSNATKKLDDAATAYRSIAGSSRDETLVDRCHFGLGRVFEMRNEPEKAREEYAQVTGALSALAKARAEQLSEARTRNSLDWLAKAEAPALTMPRSPGLPGQTPPLDVDDIKLPGATGPIDPTRTDLKLDDLFKGFSELGKDAGPTSTTNRYDTSDAAKTAEPAKTDDGKATEQPAAAEMPKEGDATKK